MALTSWLAHGFRVVSYRMRYEFDHAQNRSHAWIYHSVHGMIMGILLHKMRCKYFF